MRRALAAVALTVLILLGASPTVHADVNDFTITSFNATYTLSHDDPQGKLKIHETIAVHFTDFNHGILRALPQRYDGHPLHLKVGTIQRDGATSQYTTSTSNGNTVLKIGDPNQTITGDHRYDLDYSVVNVIHFTSNGDELDWNTNGTQWGQTFNAITATLHLKDTANKNSIHCATGYQGQKLTDCAASTQNVFMTEQPTSSSTIVYRTTQPLTAGQNMTFIASFPKGTFRPSSVADWFADYGVSLAEVALLPIATFVLALRYWLRNGKDLKGRGTIIPEYGPPKGVGPLAADVIMQYKLSTKAVSATLIDLAIRKYIRISEMETKKLLGLGTNKSYVLTQLQSDYSKLNAYESQIMLAVFADGEAVDMNALKNKFYKTAKALQKSVPTDLTTSGYFSKNPLSAGARLSIPAIVAFFVGFIIFGGLVFLAAGIILSALIALGFALLMQRRTQLGVDAKDSLEGLKLYMNVAEKDRIAMLQSPDAPYADKGDAPKQTVELFERLLPYAIVLGVEKQWAKQFEGIYTTPPDWYSGNWSSFNAGVLVGSLNNSMAVMNTSFSAPASSGSGSGGGFSGGGGGGGGGGGW